LITFEDSEGKEERAREKETRKEKELWALSLLH
jgi:hypothetical protein